MRVRPVARQVPSLGVSYLVFFGKYQCPSRFSYSFQYCLVKTSYFLKHWLKNNQMSMGNDLSHPRTQPVLTPAAV